MYISYSNLPSYMGAIASLSVSLYYNHYLSFVILCSLLPPPPPSPPSSIPPLHQLLPPSPSSANTPGSSSRRASRNSTPGGSASSSRALAPTPAERAKALVEALLTGPTTDSNLRSPLPAGCRLETVFLMGSVAVLDLRPPELGRGRVGTSPPQYPGTAGGRKRSS